MSKNKTKKPKVFISYSWTSAEHEAKVVELAEKIMSDGVNVILDKWDLKEGQDKHAFMEKMVTDDSVTKVLVVCDQAYAEKADARKGGVGTESQIISNEVYTKVEQDKFIPIITEVDEDGSPYLPTYLNSRIYIDFFAEQKFYAEYEKLLRNIYGKPIHKKPELGEAPSFVTEDDPILLKTGHKFGAFKHAIINSSPAASGLLRDYLNYLLLSLDDFHIKPIEDIPFDDTVLDSIREFKPYRDEFIEAVSLCVQYFTDDSYLEVIFEFLENSIRYKYAPENMNAYNDIWFENYDFILREIFLYLISVLIKLRKYNEAIFFLSEKYFFETNTGKKSDWYDCFDANLRSLNESRNQRLKLNRTSVTADVIKERSDSQHVSFNDLMQADLILCIRGLIANEKEDIRWYPRTLVFAERHSYHGFDIFFRAETKRHFEVLKTLLNIKDKADLVSRFQTAYSKYNLINWRMGWDSVPFSSYMNLENLYENS